jgi:lysophospholipase L1-like esterase
MISWQRRYGWIFLLILSLLANVALAWLGYKLYVADNTLRLDPLQLAVYPSTEPPKTKTRVVFFGDSRALSWPTPETDQLEFVNRGIGQQTSAQIQLRFDQHVKPLQADWLVLQLGINDLKAIPLLPNQRDHIVKQYQHNLKTIIEQAQQSGSKVLITTIFPLGEVPVERQLFWSEEVANAVDEANSYIFSLKSQNVYVLDTYHLLLGDKPQLIRPEYSRDLLHLNAEGYKRLNKALMEFFRENNKS